MTAMLASVTGPQEAEIAVAGGADIIDLKDASAGALGALPLARVEAAVAAIAGRRPVSAAAGDPSRDGTAVAAAARALAATGVNYVKVGFLPGEREQLALIQALSHAAAAIRLVAVLFADRGDDRLRLIPKLAEAGFAGVMLDTADKTSGRLLLHLDIAGLSAFVQAARAHGLLAGLAGRLEVPDVPRLVALDPDVLGFRSALCAGNRERTIDLESTKAIRRLIPPDRAQEDAKSDRRILPVGGQHPDDAASDQVLRVYVRDFVLPVDIGAYSHERRAPQKVRFDVIVEVRRTPGEPRGMGDVFSYDLINDAIAVTVAEGHIDFVEMLAERIGARILSDPRASRVTVKVEKLETGPGGVGVELEMKRPGQGSQQDPA